MAAGLTTGLTTGWCTWLAASATRATHSAATGSASGLPCRGSTTLSGSTRRLRRALRRIRALPGLLAIGLAVAIGVFARAVGTRSARGRPGHGGIAQATAGRRSAGVRPGTTTAASTAASTAAAGLTGAALRTRAATGRTCRAALRAALSTTSRTGGAR